MKFQFTELNLDLLPEVEILQADYRRIYPDTVAVPARTYLAPWLGGGKNVICALDDTGKLCGYAPVISAPPTDSDSPHTFWTDIKVDLSSPTKGVIQDLLLEKIQDRAREMAKYLPEGKKRFIFQYHITEQDSIEYILSKGGIYAESAFKMRRDLSQDIPDMDVPAAMEIQYSHMETEIEQQAYLNVRNEALVKGRQQLIPVSVIDLPGWQSILEYVIRPSGTVILAYDSNEIIGSASVFCDKEKNLKANDKVGITDFVFVINDWRRKGIASYMLCKGLEYFKENGLEYAELEVNASNRNALSLYEKLGYSVVDQSDFYILDLS